MPFLCSKMLIFLNSLLNEVKAPEPGPHNCSKPPHLSHPLLLCFSDPVLSLDWFSPHLLCTILLTVFFFWFAHNIPSAKNFFPLIFRDRSQWVLQCPIQTIQMPPVSLVFFPSFLPDATFPTFQRPSLYFSVSCVHLSIFTLHQGPTMHKNPNRVIRKREFESHLPIQSCVIWSKFLTQTSMSSFLKVWQMHGTLQNSPQYKPYLK